MKAKTKWLKTHSSSFPGLVSVQYLDSYEEMIREQIAKEIKNKSKMELCKGYCFGWDNLNIVKEEVIKIVRGVK